jgi:hypothetical protein
VRIGRAARKNASCDRSPTTVRNIHRKKTRNLSRRVERLSPAAVNLSCGFLFMTRPFRIALAVALLGGVSVATFRSLTAQPANAKRVPWTTSPPRSISFAILPTSLMSDNLLRDATAVQAADLLAYLWSLK